jgi:hypothetical protein
MEHVFSDGIEAIFIVLDGIEEIFSSQDPPLRA